MFIVSQVVATLRDNGLRAKKHGRDDNDEWVVCVTSSSCPRTEERDLIPNNPGSYRWLAIELRSRVFQDELAAYEEMRLVVNLLKLRYRLRAKATCGFQVGIGTGFLYFDTRTLKRTAAFLFAADPILSRLHIPWRRIARYSASVRYAI
ncbi:hypothetical protein F5Y17DRAFT_225730 [Xylariaceae sp. FL0594]|nr:hypothetical protein F5Y17DRAFT_225730 [Xylariaceae sp. FL0594]